MSTKQVKIKMTYADLSNRIYTIDISHIPNDSSTMTAFETHAIAQAQAINTAAADQNSSVANTFVSNGGAKITGISELSTVITTEEILYNGG